MSSGEGLNTASMSGSISDVLHLRYAALRAGEARPHNEHTLGTPRINFRDSRG